MKKGNNIKSLTYLLTTVINLLSMATVITGTQFTNKDMLPTRDELLDYMLAISELMSQQALCINCYKPKKLYSIFRYFDHEKRMECKKIVDEFMENYLNCSI